ncbi:MAG: MBL fold metallo-hydrolase [Candidatus Eisenbacteria bacterium]|nr:MBL fold metallo-hydrolase [Candidatus Eisenbacteria bacterium]
MHRDGETQLRVRIALVFVFAMALLTLWAPWSLAIEGNGKLQIHHIAVGQGDGAVIITPEGRVVLVDSGDNCTLFVSYISSLGITSVDYHFASHYHADHIGCLDNLLATGVTLDIAGYDRGYSYTTQAYTTYVNTLGAKRQTMAKNQVVTLDSLSAHPVYIKCVDLNGAGVYSPTGSDENAKSMVLKVSYGEFDESLGGDLTASPSVEPTVGPEMGDVEVYKVHHHSASTSSYDAWLNATTPEVAVISLGGNSYGYVPAATLTRLHSHGVKTYWTNAGSSASPVEGWDKVGGNIVIQADWSPGAPYTVTGSGFVDTYYNSGTAADLTPPEVAVLKPVGGEILYVGSEEMIEWIATDNVGVDSVSMYYSTDGGATFPYTIATGEQNDSSYTWLVPDTPSDSCVVKIVAYDSSLNSGEGVSASLFSIRGEVGVDGAIAAWGFNGTAQCNVPAPNADFVAIAAGWDHSLGLKSDSTIVAWGYNNSGQCNVPAPNADFVAIAATGRHSLGLKSDSTIVAWGDNGEGQCNVPAPNADFVAIDAGGWFSLGLKSDGTIVAWGLNNFGQCNVPVPNADFVAISAGGDHSLGLKSDSTIVAWGYNGNGQCNVPAPNADFVALAGGWYHSLGVKSDGTVVAWGRNDYGECNIPAENADFVAVAGGCMHSLGVKSDGTIVTWGWNESGQCNVPVPNADFVAVEAGGYNSLGLKRPSVISVEGPKPAVVPGASMLSVVSVSPNPFNPSVEIVFERQGSGQVAMEIYDVRSRHIRTVSLGFFGSGLHRARWDGRDASGADVSSGVYFIRLWSTEAESLPVKAVLIR